jgi:hypothetical protein
LVCAVSISLCSCKTQRCGSELGDVPLRTYSASADFEGSPRSLVFELFCPSLDTNQSFCESDYLGILVKEIIVDGQKIQPFPILVYDVGGVPRIVNSSDGHIYLIRARNVGRDYWEFYFNDGVFTNRGANLSSYRIPQTCKNLEIKYRPVYPWDKVGELFAVRVNGVRSAWINCGGPQHENDGSAPAATPKQ